MPDPAGRLEDYLSDLRERLGGLPADEVAEILAELRSHVRDACAPGREPDQADVTAVLARLGAPSALAAAYRADRLLAQAERSPSPWLLLKGLFRWAALSGAGSFALCGVVVGYVLTASFFLAALVKPFRPDRVGLFRIGDGEHLSLHLGLTGSAAPPGAEILGWWIVPLGLLLGGLAYGLTRSFARRAVRRHRRRPLAAWS
jgi:hypothetical protein